MSRRGGGGGGATAAAPTESTQLLSSAGGGIRQPFDATTAMAQPPHRHAQMHEAAEAIDPVERLVKHALTGTAVTLFLVFLGVLFLVLKALGFDRLPVLARLPPALHSYWAVFTPFWLADLVLLALVAEVLHGIFTLRATSRAEKRNMARIPPARRPPQYDKIVSMEMFPLVQTLLRGALAALPLLACAVAAQVLFCLRLEGVPISVWQALLPILMYEALALLGALCLRHGSWQQGLAWGLALLSTLALALRLSPDAWPPSAGTSWAALRPLWVAFTPLWALEAFLLLLLLHVALQAGRCVRRYKLNAQHVACTVMYTLSLLLFAGAQALIAWDRALEDALDGAFPSLADGVDDARGRHSSSSSSSNNNNSSEGGRSSSAAAAHKEPPPLPPPSAEQPAVGGLADALAGIAVFCGVGLLCLALFLVAEERADYLVTSHGYEDPLPLSRTAKGWEPTGARFSSWLLLGRIEETARLMRGGARAGAVGIATAAMAAMGGRGGLQGQGQREGARRGLDASPAGPELKRSNSGSYADLYADL